MKKTFRDLKLKPQYSYLDQLRDFKQEMETEPMAGLWGTTKDYEPKDEDLESEDFAPAHGRVNK